MPPTLASGHNHVLHMLWLLQEEENRGTQERGEHYRK